MADYTGQPIKLFARGQSPSAFFMDNDPNQLWIFYSRVENEVTPGDQIWLKNWAGWGPWKVLVPLANQTAIDSMHCASPAIVQNVNPSAYWGKQFFMYYEGAPRLYSKSNMGWCGDVYNQICIVGSNDLYTWERFWPYPIIAMDQNRKNTCGEQVINGKVVWDYTKAECSPFWANYGPGHPSAIVHANALVELFFYDYLRGDPGRMWKAWSWDYVHFFNFHQTSLEGGWKVRYNPTVGMYVATGQPELNNRFQFSNDGITFNGEFCSMPNRITGLGQGTICQPSIVADQWGRIYSWDVPFISGEGTWDDKSTRDWSLYQFQGKFNF